MKYLYLLLTICFISQQSIAEQNYTPKKYPHLKIENNFSDPLSVLNYYLERDAYGFIWSGLLNIERTEFTQWNTAPQSESFQVAKHYLVKKIRASSTEALYEVTYDLLYQSDQYETRIPASQRQLKVEYRLNKVSGKWKITSPHSSKIIPIVIKGKFDR